VQVAELHHHHRLTGSAGGWWREVHPPAEAPLIQEVRQLPAIGGGAFSTRACDRNALR
jgi:hypothetical protein